MLLETLFWSWLAYRMFKYRWLYLKSTIIPSHFFVFYWNFIIFRSRFVWNSINFTLKSIICIIIEWEAAPTWKIFGKYSLQAFTVIAYLQCITQFFFHKLDRTKMSIGNISFVMQVIWEAYSWAIIACYFLLYENWVSFWDELYWLLEWYDLSGHEKLCNFECI